MQMEADEIVRTVLQRREDKVKIVYEVEKKNG